MSDAMLGIVSWGREGWRDKGRGDIGTHLVVYLVQEPLGTLLARLFSRLGGVVDSNQIQTFLCYNY
jgi:hypothetical protein